MQNNLEEKSNSLTLNNNIIDLFLEYINDSEDSSSHSFDSTKEYNDSQQSKSYFDVKKSNIIKNILKSFQRFIESSNKVEQQNLISHIKKGQSFSQAKKLIKRNFKTFGKRWNMKLKYLLGKSSFKGLFDYYLNNKSQLWLDTSKVQNKDEHKVVIQFLIQALNKPEYAEEIKYYKKRRSMTSDK
ncbi:hypothetical protein ABPG72_015507 [Tetrahymena utriculariae]